MKKLLPALLGLLISSGVGAVEGQLRLGLGFGESSFGGPSDHSKQLNFAAAAEWQNGLVVDLRYLQDDFDSSDETSYLTLKAAWTVWQDELSRLRLGLLLERLEGRFSSLTTTDDAIGVGLGFDYALAKAVSLEFDLAYLRTNDDKEDISDNRLAVVLDMGAGSELYLQYWLRNISDNAGVDFDQDAISFGYGLNF